MSQVMVLIPDPQAAQAQTQTRHMPSLYWFFLRRYNAWWYIKNFTEVHG